MRRLILLLLVGSAWAQLNLPAGVGWHSLGANTQPSNRTSQEVFYANTNYPVAPACTDTGSSNVAGGGTPSTGVLTSVCAPAGDPAHSIGGGNGPITGLFTQSGAMFDTKRNRFIFTGGGDLDYFGDELYEINLNGAANSWTWNRISPVADSPVYSCIGTGCPNPATYIDPNTGVNLTCGIQTSVVPNEKSGPGANQGCSGDATRTAQIESIPGAQLHPNQTTLPAHVYPNSAHRYSSEVYDPDTDQMIMTASGALAAVRGQHANATWALDMASVPSCGAGCSVDDGTHNPSWHIVNNFSQATAGNNVSDVFQFYKVTDTAWDPVLHTWFTADEAADSSLESLSEYVVATGLYTKVATTAVGSLGNALGPMGHGGSPLVIDPVRRKAIIFYQECANVVDALRCGNVANGG